MTKHDKSLMITLALVYIDCLAGKCCDLVFKSCAILLKLYTRIGAKASKSGLSFVVAAEWPLATTNRAVNSQCNRGAYKVEIIADSCNYQCE